MLSEIRDVPSLDRSAALVTGYGEEKLPNVSYGAWGEAEPTCVDIVRDTTCPNE